MKIARRFPLYWSIMPCSWEGKSFQEIVGLITLLGIEQLFFYPALVLLALI